MLEERASKEEKWKKREVVSDWNRTFSGRSPDSEYDGWLLKLNSDRLRLEYSQHTLFSFDPRPQQGNKISNKTCCAPFIKGKVSRSGSEGEGRFTCSTGLVFTPLLIAVTVVSAVLLFKYQPFVIVFHYFWGSLLCTLRSLCWIPSWRAGRVGMMVVKE
jgi:hypothetical protein